MTEEYFTVKDCEIVVKKCLKTDRIETVDFAVVRLPNSNFLVKIIVKHDAEKKILNFFAKSVQETPQINQILSNFKKTIPQFDVKITPKLYYNKSDLLFFEDLTWQGFQTCRSEFDLLHLRQVLKTLAKFHAGSFAYEEIKSKELGRSYRLDEEHKVDYANISLREDKVKNLIETEDWGNLLQNLEEIQFSQKHRKTLCHSNLITENIMFKYENGAPIQCKLINFKSRHYAPPIYDVLQLIFFNTDEKLRQQHLEQLVQDYHNYLSEELGKYQIGEILTLDENKITANYILPLIKLEKIFKCNLQSEAIEEFKEVIHCPFLTREDCYVIVNNALKIDSYDLLSFKVTPIDSAAGYLGNYHKLKIKILHQHEEKSIDCFVKRTPRSETSRGIVEQTGCFFKEVFVYQTLISQMENMGVKIIQDCLPNCYFQRPEDFMVFEDLALKNFRILSVYESFNGTLLALAVKKLAKFHATTLIFEEEMSKKMKKEYRLNEEYGEFLQEIFLMEKDDHLGSKIFTTGAKSIPDVVDLFPDLKIEQDFNKLSECMPKLQKLFFEVVKTSTRFRNVLCHGDLWTNNIIIKFDDEKPVDCCFVDFQCTRYCPPAHDFLSILHLTTDRSTRMAHEEELGKIYHDELGKILDAYSYNIDTIYPFKDFVEDVRIVKPEMVMQSIMYRTFMCAPEEISSLLANDEVCNQVFYEDRKQYLRQMSEKSSEWKCKIKDCVLDLYELCSNYSF